MSAPVNRRPPALLWALRVIGAALLAGTAWIHLYLWQNGYDSIAWIGPLFLANAVGGFVLAAALLVAPRRLLFWPAAAGALLELGTLGGLILATTVGLFGFVESTKAQLYWQSVAVEAAGTIVLLVVGLLCLPVRRAIINDEWTEPARTRG
jgi:hypothetical protein